ncbi:urease subunit beta [Gracilibacillus alcaliphilus]|uniref:urease subunit beta n=1 Tax=Gracilibacillus alcaliphilus TaxID=1401441 RepID=UPI00195DFEA1|nr:urease subunit beta [Gracilibacillus alcaliphilus]MBM7677498.1 urease beta subunit [Gracilibacillus alcaliphilus]
MIPGEIRTPNQTIKLNHNRRKEKIRVANSGDRPIQVGSHYHFAEVNRDLLFERSQAYGMRLNIASGTATRFEPGEEKIVELVEIGGDKAVYGFHGLVEGNLEQRRDKVIKAVTSFSARQCGES